MIIRADKWASPVGVIMILLGFVVTLAGLKSFLGIVILGLIITASGWITMRMGNKREDEIFKEEMETIKNEFKKYGEAVRVEFSKCEIKTNDYSEEEETESDDRDQIWNALTDETKSTRVVDVYQSVIVFKYEHDGMVETFYSGIIPKEREHLLFILDNKKETMLYIDKNDRERYFFDLDFLNKRHQSPMPN